MFVCVDGFDGFFGMGCGYCCDNDGIQIWMFEYFVVIYVGFDISWFQFLLCLVDFFGIWGEDGDEFSLRCLVEDIEGMMGFYLVEVSIGDLEFVNSYVFELRFFQVQG